MVCDVCGHEGARIRRVTRSYGKGATILIIENVPVLSCPHCGTSYLERVAEFHWRSSGPPILPATSVSVFCAGFGPASCAALLRG